MKKTKSFCDLYDAIMAHLAIVIAKHLDYDGDPEWPAWNDEELDNGISAEEALDNLDAQIAELEIEVDTAEAPVIVIAPNAQ